MCVYLTPAVIVGICVYLTPAVIVVIVGICVIPVGIYLTQIMPVLQQNVAQLHGAWHGTNS